MVAHHLVLCAHVFQKLYKEMGGESEISLLQKQNYGKDPQREKLRTAEKDAPHLYLSDLSAEDPCAEGEGKDRDFLSEMQNQVYQKELISCLAM